MIFHRVVSPSRQHLGNLCPLVAHDPVSVEQGLVLLLRPLRLVHSSIEVVVPPLAALLAVAPRHLACNECPLLYAMARDERPQAAVLIRRPGLAVVVRSFMRRHVCSEQTPPTNLDRRPAFEALHLRLSTLRSIVGLADLRYEAL